jgi:hypothetical protein
MCHKVPEGEDIPARRQEINTHLQMFGIIIVYPFKCQPTPYNVTRIVAEVGVGERVSDFDVASSFSEAFQTCRNHFWHPGHLQGTIHTKPVRQFSYLLNDLGIGPFPHIDRVGRTKGANKSQALLQDIGHNDAAAAVVLCQRGGIETERTDLTIFSNGYGYWHREHLE